MAGHGWLGIAIEKPSGSGWVSLLPWLPVPHTYCYHIFAICKFSDPFPLSPFYLSSPLRWFKPENVPFFFLFYWMIMGRFTTLGLFSLSFDFLVKRFHGVLKDGRA